MNDDKQSNGGTMTRWLKETFRPRLKCERIGHTATEVRYRVYAAPESHGLLSGVADMAVLTRTECRRCGDLLSKGTITDRQSIDSLSMPSDDHDRLKSDGFLILGRANA